jgi:uncharacterized protein YabE (DUF348 family)
VRPAESRGRIFSDQRARAQRRTKAHALHFRGRHHAAAISVVVILVVVMFQLFPRRDVTILSDGQAFRVSTAFDGSSEALAAADVNVEPGDRTLYGSGGKYNAVIVQRARPVIFEVDGVTTEKRTRLSTVGGALADAGIVLGPNDKVLLDVKPAAERVPLVSSASLPKSATNEQGVTTGLAPGDASAIPVHISVIRARPVTVFVDTERRDAQTSADTIGGLLTELGMPVRESDLVSPIRRSTRRPPPSAKSSESSE